MNLVPGHPRRRSLGAVTLPALLAPSAVLLAAAAGSALLLPVLATAAVYPVMARLLLRGQRAAALAATLLWAASLSAAVIVQTTGDPVGAGDLVLRGPAYRDEMFAFIRDGSGRESDPVRFLPQHAMHLGAFVALTSISGGLLGMALGAVLIGYMSYYVGALAASGGAPALAILLGWHPWAILRVVAYSVLGVALSGPVLHAARRRFLQGAHPPVSVDERSGPPGGAVSWRSWYLTALVLLLADAILKAILAPAWAVLLRPCLGAP